MVITKTFETYEEADGFIKAHEHEHGLRYVTWKVAKDFLEKITTLKNRKIRFPTVDVPYIHLRNGRAYRSCSLGGREGAKHIKKSIKSNVSRITGKRKRPYENMDEEDKAIPACHASIIVQSVTIFPQFEVTEEMNKHTKSKITVKLRSEFSPVSTYMESRFMVEIDEEHTNHRKKFHLKLDPRATEAVVKAIELGYYSPAEIQERMKIIMSKLEDVNDTNKVRFTPSIDRLRKFCFTYVVKQRNLEREKGFTHDLQEPLDRMRELELETNASFVGYEDFESFGLFDVYETSKSKSIYTSPESDLRCKVTTDGVPYIVLQTKHFECSRGVEYQNKFLLPFTPRERKHMSKEGMFMCTARCTFKEIALFPGYRIDESLRQKQARIKILDHLREDLNNRTADYERVIAYAFPVVDEHSGHQVREANGHLFLEEGIKHEIKDLVEEGVRNMSEMKRHLKMYLKHKFDDEYMPGPFNKRYRPSNQTIMNLMYDAGLPPEDIVQDVTDPVEYISKPSQYKDISTRVEEKRRRRDASATMSLITDAESLVETSYDALMDNLDVFQNISATGSKVGNRHDASPRKSPKGSAETTSTAANEFSDVLFKKQSECQSLLEELLQVVYEMSDHFRLRDLHHHLRKLTEFVKGGRILCDVIPLKRKQPAPPPKEDESVDSEDKPYTATPIDLATGLASATTSEEPPTKLVIMDQNEQVTEVELPKEYDSSEIVIYQENDETGEQIYLVDNKQFDDDEKGQDAKAEEDTKVATESISPDLEAKRKLYKENAQKDMIKVKCKQYVSKDVIMRKLNIDLKRGPAKFLPSKVKPSSTDINSDIKKEIKVQKEDHVRYQEENKLISLMERRYRMNGSQSHLIEYQEYDLDGNSPKKAKKMSKVANKTDHDYSESPKKVDQDDDNDGADVGMISDESENDLGDEKITMKVPITMPVKPTPNNKADTPGTKLSLAAQTAPSTSLKPKAIPQTQSPSLKPGDTITFPKGFNALLNNQSVGGSQVNNPGLAGGLIAINNVVYTNTPYGLIPAFGMPLVVGGQSGGILIGNPAANQTIQLGINPNTSVASTTVNTSVASTTVNTSVASTTVNTSVITTNWKTAMATPTNIPSVATSTVISSVATPTVTSSVTTTRVSPSVAMATLNSSGLTITLNPQSSMTTSTTSTTLTPSKLTDSSVQPTSNIPVSSSNSLTNEVQECNMEDSENSDEGTNTADPEIVDDELMEAIGSEVSISDEQHVPSTNSDPMKTPITIQARINQERFEKAVVASTAEGLIVKTSKLQTQESNTTGQGQEKPATEPIVKKTYFVRKDELKKAIDKNAGNVKKNTIAMVHIPSVNLTPGMSIKKIDTPSSSKDVPEKYVVLPTEPLPKMTSMKAEVAVRGKTSNLVTKLVQLPDSNVNTTTKSAGQAIHTSNLTQTHVNVPSMGAVAIKSSGSGSSPAKNSISQVNLNGNTSELRVRLAAGPVTIGNCTSQAVNMLNPQQASVNAQATDKLTTNKSVKPVKIDTNLIHKKNKGDKFVVEHGQDDDPVVITYIPSKPYNDGTPKNDCPTETLPSPSITSDNASGESGTQTVRTVMPVNTKTNVKESKGSAKTITNVPERNISRAVMAAKAIINLTTTKGKVKSVGMDSNPTITSPEKSVGSATSSAAINKEIQIPLARLEDSKDTSSPTRKGIKTQNKPNLTTTDDNLAPMDKTRTRKKDETVQIDKTPVGKDKTVQSDKTPIRKDEIVKSDKTQVKKGEIVKKDKTPVRKKDETVLTDKAAGRKEVTVQIDKTPVTKSRSDQGKAARSSSDDITDSGKMKTRGRQMRFSMSGEKLK